MANRVSGLGLNSNEQNLTPYNKMLIIGIINILILFLFVFFMLNTVNFGITNSLSIWGVLFPHNILCVLKTYYELDKLRKAARLIASNPQLQTNLT